MSEVSDRLVDRLDRIERAITTLAWWLVQAQTGFGERDARGIEDILKPSEQATEEGAA
jgi:hypothetical protein